METHSLSQTERLTRRNGNWIYRRRVPKRLVGVLGCKEIHRSLRTSSLKEARRLRAAADVAWDSRFKFLEENEKASAGAKLPETPAPISTQEMLRRVQEYVLSMDAKAADASLRDPPASEAERDAMLESVGMAETILRDRDDPRALEWICGTLVQLTAPNHPSLAEAAFGEIVRRALIELERRKLDRLNDRFSSAASDLLFSHNVMLELCFGDLAQQFLNLTQEEATANRTNQKWVDKQKSHVALLVEIIGHKTALCDVNYDACMRLRSLLGRIPANRSKRYAKLTVEESAAAAEADGKNGLSAATQKAYLATFQGIMDLALRKRLISTNPAEGLKPLKKEVVTASAKRLPFAAEQLKAFFGGKFYRKCAERQPAWRSDPQGWRFWLPLLCLFMGMRPNEVCQMGVADVRKTDNATWYLDVVATEDDEEADTEIEKSLKTVTSRRRIPIHPEILALGFLDFVDFCRKAGFQRLFPDLIPDRYGNCAKYALRRFRETFLPGEVVLRPRQSFYSFRHNFRDALRAIDAPPDALQALGGWSQGKLTSDDYGDKANPDYQVQFIEKISFPTLSLVHLLPACGTSKLVNGTPK
jgi:integrase